MCISVVGSLTFEHVSSAAYMYLFISMTFIGETKVGRIFSGIPLLCALIIFKNNAYRHFRLFPIHS